MYKYAKYFIIIKMIMLTANKEEPFNTNLVDTVNISTKTRKMGIKGNESQDTNKIMHSSIGNQRHLIIGSYNVGKGLFESDNWGSDKLWKIKAKIRKGSRF